MLVMKLETMIGTSGFGVGEIKGPSSVSIDSDGNIYVVCRKSGRSLIEVFDSSGGSRGRWTDITNPTPAVGSNIDIDDQDILYIHDSTRRGIIKYQLNN